MTAEVLWRSRSKSARLQIYGALRAFENSLKLERVRWRGGTVFDPVSQLPRARRPEERPEDSAVALLKLADWCEKEVGHLNRLAQLARIRASDISATVEP